MTTVREKYNKIRTLREQMEAEQRELAISLEIQELWPGAFSCGKCSSKLVDNNGKSNMTEHHSQRAYKRGELFIRITNGGGKHVDINARLASKTLLLKHGFVPKYVLLGGALGPPT